MRPTLTERLFAALWARFRPGFQRQMAGDATVTFARRRRRIRRQRGALAASLYATRNLASLTRTLVVQRLSRSRLHGAPLGVPEIPGDSFMASFIQDTRHAWRGFRRAPAFTLLIAATLALGIGLNTAMFATLDAVLLSPLPYGDPDRLVAVNITLQGNRWWSSSLADVLEWRAGTRTLESVAFALPDSVSLSTDESAEQLVGARTSANFFDTLEVRPELGRTFAAGEDGLGAAPVAVLDAGFWRRRFAADPAIVGRGILVDGAETVVVGVLPDSFRADFLGNPQIWVTRRFSIEDARERGRIYVPVARLGDGVDVPTAQADLDRVARAVAADHPESMTGWGVHLVPLHEAVAGDAQRPLSFLFGAVGLVLLVSCANISSLLLARATTRRRELAIRAAIGAGRGRLTRLLLVESLWLALLGGALALPLAGAVTDALAVIDNGPPRLDQAGLDPRALAFATVTVLLSTLLAGLLPAVRSGRRAPRACLAEGSLAVGAGEAGRLRAVLVAGEVALVAVLLIGAGLLLRSYGALRAVDPGFETRDRLVAQIDLPTDFQYGDIQRIAAFYRDLRERLSAHPGVAGVADVTRVPMVSRAGMTAYHLIEGRPATPGDEPVGGVEVVSPSYFEVMGMRVVAGRGFDSTDDASAAPVVVINETMAELYWPDGDPIGDRVGLGPAANGAQVALAREIVGIVSGVRYGLDLDVRPRLYLPDDQMPMPMSGRGLIVLSRGGDAASLVADVRRVVREIDPYQALGATLTFDQVIERSVAGRRLQTVLLGSFGAVALLLGAMGVYGLVSHAVTHRIHEMGVRMALGAARRDVLRLVLASALRPVMAGLVLGTLGALALSGSAARLLYGISATDPATYVTVSGVLMAVAVVAALVPARRATRVDPVRSLRSIG